MPVKFYTFFGVVNRVVDAFLDVANPLASDVAVAQVRPYDGGVNPMFSTYASIDSVCDKSYALRANQDIYHQIKVTPNTVAIIRSRQLQTILDGVNYLGNRVYLVSLNDLPLIYTDNENPAVVLFFDDIANTNITSYARDFVHCAVEGFTPSLMSKVFVQQTTSNYTATTVKGWVSAGYVYVNPFGYSVKYNEGGEALTSVSLAAGDKVRVKKDDVCLRPLLLNDGYTLVNGGTAYYWSTLPSVSGWTTNVLLSYVKDTTEYPFCIEMVHTASGGVLISFAGSTGGTNTVKIPGWWYPILMFQYALGKAGYLGVSPSYVVES
jgi:hypothetical protein